MPFFYDRGGLTVMVLADLAVDVPQVQFIASLALDAVLVVLGAALGNLEQLEVGFPRLSRKSNAGSGV